MEVSRFEEINEAMGASEITIAAVCAASFVLLRHLFALTPLGEDGLPDRRRLRREFWPGFMHGSVFGAGVALAFMIGGIYHFVGFFVHVDNAVLAIASIVLRGASIIVLAFCEENIFRKILALDSNQPWVGWQRVITPRARFWHDFSAIAITAVFFAGIKALQFDLGWMQVLTLALVSVLLGFRALPVRGIQGGADRSFVLSAGFWSAILIVFHVLLSLPVLGHEFSGLILIKYKAVAAAPESTAPDTLRFLTGGAGGPLASFAFQVLVCLEIFRAAARYRTKNCS